MKDWLYDNAEPLILGGAFLVLVAITLWLCYEEQAYQRLHHCEPTGQQRVDWIFVPMSFDGGKTTIIMPQQVTHIQYQCDNGEHWT